HAPSTSAAPSPHAEAEMEASATHSPSTFCVPAPQSNLAHGNRTPPEPSTREAELYDTYLKPQDWLGQDS
ncbi:MAG: hypothetical protein AAF889_10975, partial [Cyanobacteria bacterium P01_D01_bin.73]